MKKYPIDKPIIYDEWVKWKTDQYSGLIDSRNKEFKALVRDPESMMAQLAHEGWKEVTDHDYIVKTGDIVPHNKNFEDGRGGIWVLGVAGTSLSERTSQQAFLPPAQPPLFDKEIHLGEDGVEITLDMSQLKTPVEAAPNKEEERAKEILKLTNVNQDLLIQQGWRKRDNGEIVERGDILGSIDKSWQLASFSIGHTMTPKTLWSAWTLKVKEHPPGPTYLLKAVCQTTEFPKHCKAMCPANGYTVRVTRKWVDRFGPPLCPKCSHPMILAPIPGTEKKSKPNQT